MHEATLRIEGDGSYAAATSGTDAMVELWCNNHCDFLYVENDTNDEILIHIRESVGVKERLQWENESVIITAECLKNHEGGLIEKYLADHSCLFLPPLRYASGAKSCRVLALDSTNLTACYRHLIEDGFTVSVERKREIKMITHHTPLLTLEEVLPDFSSRQREILNIAYDMGYYEIPRETTTTEIADTVGIERRTAEEHLRRAENKLTAAFIDHIKTDFL